MKKKSEFNPTVAALGHEKDVEQDWIEVKIGDTIQNSGALENLKNGLTVFEKYFHDFFF